MEQYWSWLLAAIGVAGIYFVGRKTIWGWLVLLVNECLWVAYALSTDQYGFIFMAVAYAAVYIRSYIHWKKEDRSYNDGLSDIYYDPKKDKFDPDKYGLLTEL